MRHHPPARALVILALAGTLSLAAAARGKGDKGDGQNADRGNVTVTLATPYPYVSANAEIPRVREVIVRDDGLNPSQVTVPAAQAVQLQVSNQSGKECVFFFGQFARGQRIPAGQAQAISFTVPQQDAETGTMGCEGDPQRQGSYVIDFRGLPVKP